jgi:glycosyltransferase involved in cell wall biosynthesis
VRFEIGISDERLLELYEGALAVYTGPLDEDFGYVTLEGLAAERPVVTLTDSGGPLEFVTDGQTGLVVEPRPASIAAAFDRLHANRDEAAGYGRAGNELIRDTIPSWPQVISRLLET